MSAHHSPRRELVLNELRPLTVLPEYDIEDVADSNVVMLAFRRQGGTRYNQIYVDRWPGIKEFLKTHSDLINDYVEGKQKLGLAPEKSQIVDEYNSVIATIVFNLSSAVDVMEQQVADIELRLDRELVQSQRMLKKQSEINLQQAEKVLRKQADDYAFKMTIMIAALIAAGFTIVAAFAIPLIENMISNRIEKHRTEIYRDQYLELQQKTIELYQAMPQPTVVQETKTPEASPTSE